MNFKEAQHFIIASILAIISFSCSLNYSKEAQNFEKKPNFVFKNAILDQYEENSLNLLFKSPYSLCLIRYYVNRQSKAFD